MEKYMSDLFKAMSDENRLKILSLLIAGETCGCTLIDKLPISQPTLSYHLKALTDAKITIAKKEGVWVKHTVDTSKIDEMMQFLQDLKDTTVACNL